MGERSKGSSLLAARAVTGFYCLSHGLARFGLGGSQDIGDYADYLAGLGLAAPSLCAWTLAIGQIAGGALLLVGFMHRSAALFLIALMIGQVWFVHGARYFSANEYPLAIAALAFVIFAHGPGPFAYQLEVRKSKS